MKNALVKMALLALLLPGSAKAQDITVTWQVTGDKISTGYLPKVASDGQNYVATIDMENAFPVHDGFPNSPFQYQLGAIDAASIGWTGADYFLHSPPQPQGDHQIGHAPSLALYYETGAPNCDTAVEVHQGAQHVDSELWYQLGRFCSTAGIRWFHASHYANGYNATVAADNNETFPRKTTVVEVHQTDNATSALFYQVGVVTGSAPPSISWGPSTAIIQSNGSALQGNLPTVSIANNLAIIVAEDAEGGLWYSFGSVDTSTSTIAWSDPISYGNGFNPTVSIFGDGTAAYGLGTGRVVVEAHQMYPGTGSLLYTAGLLAGTPPTSITWSSSVDNYYATGCYPSVALSFDGLAPSNPTTGSTSSLSLTATNEIDCGTGSTIEYSFGYLVATP